jgi:two-component system, cell cycle response regulator
VARLAGAVGERMGLPAEARVQLRQAAELHDIGKLGIPEEILDKPGPLDAEEWTFVRRHPLIGERIIGRRPRPGVGGQAGPLHPRASGRHRLPRRAVRRPDPPGARIIAVVDAFSELVVELVWPSEPSPAVAGDPGGS